MTSSDMLTLPMDDSEKEKCKGRIERLRHTNTVLLTELQSVGAGVDYTVGMIHTMFESLVEIGALEEDQWLTLQLIWEERFNSQLTAMKGQVQKAISQAETRARLGVAGAGQPPKLIIPNT